MTTPPPEDLEELLAEAMQRFDEGGEAALAAFVAAHPQQASALERGIRRCRSMGLLGDAPGTKTASHPERLGDYRLLRRIGAGGMGVVYEAIQEPLDRRVALKVVRPELLFFDGARERFRREIDAIARLEHPGIVSVFAAGEHDGVPFFAMELIDGLTIDRITEQLQGRDPAKLRGDDLALLLQAPSPAREPFAGAFWEVAVWIGVQLAQALRHAHVRGIVHRDVKPSNGIVTAHGRVVVLDFGVAQVRSQRDLTRSGAQPGSPAFMSPEQWAGRATDERTDVFSLAATLWQLLTLQRPFRGADEAARADRLPPLRTRCRTAPRELDLVLRTAMDPDRDCRYGDMAAFAADLQAVLDRRPIAARPPGLGLRALRWTQRHRTIAVALGVAVVATAASATALFLVQREASAALRAEQARTRDSLDTAIEALQSILVRLGNSRLLAVPQAGPVAHAALLDAAALFRDLMARHPDDGRVRLNAGQALHALALSFGRRGELEQAIATVQEAIALLGGEQPATPPVADVRGHAWSSLAGFLLDRRQREAAIAANARAEADFAVAATAAKFVAESLRARGELQTQRSLLGDEQRDPAAVEQALRQAVALQRECIARGEPDPKDPSLLVQHLTNLGKFLQRQERRPEARAVLTDAMALAKELPVDGTWPPPTVYVAEVQDTLGSVLLRDGDPAAAAMLREGVAARQQATEAYPSMLEFRIRLGGALHNLARVLVNEKRWAEALPEFERARDIQQEVLARQPGHVIAVDFLGKHLDMVGFCQIQLGDGAGAAATARAIAALPTKDPLRAVRAAEYLVQAHRLTGGTDAALLDEAMAQLLAAEARGARGGQVPDARFAALHARPEYAALRSRLDTSK